MQQKQRRWGPILLIPIAVLLLIVFVIARDETPSAPVKEEVAPPEPPAPEVDTMAVVTDGVLLAAAETPPQEATEPAPATAPKRRGVKKQKQAPVEEAPAERAPVEEAPVVDPGAPVEAAKPEELKPEEPIAPPPPPEPVLAGIDVLYQEDLPWLRTMSIEVIIDGKVAGTKKLAEDEAAQPVSVFAGQLPVGRHALDLRIKMLGDGGGLFSYLEDYAFTAKQHAVLDVEEGGGARLVVRAIERGATNNWEERVGLKVEVKKNQRPAM
jgi:hypothetical protein